MEILAKILITLTLCFAAHGLIVSDLYLSAEYTNRVGVILGVVLIICAILVWTL